MRWTDPVLSIFISLTATAQQQDIAGSSRIPRFNLYPAISLSGNTAPGYSSGEGLERMEQIKYAVLEKDGSISIIPFYLNQDGVKPDITKG